MRAPLVYISRSARAWLFSERLRAIKECPDLDFQRARRDKVIPFPYRCCLLVHRNTKDGCTLASVVISMRGSNKRWVRKLRYVPSVPLTEAREIGLRRASNPS